MRMKTQLLESIYARLLRESKKFRGDWGDIAFGEDRGGEVYEEDTPEEEDAFAALRRHIYDNKSMLPDDALAIMAAEETGRYSDVLKPPDVDRVYRGVALNRTELEGIIGRKLTPEEFDGGQAPCKGMLGREASWYASSAWTTDIETAIKFAINIKKPWTAFAVFEAPVALNRNTFLDGKDGFYKLRSFVHYADEDEVIALGGVKGAKVTWTKFSPRNATMSVIEKATAYKASKAELRKALGVEAPRLWKAEY